MASLISRARATALMATLGALCVSAATAADMPFASPLPPPPPVDQPVEFGTGWYLRGDVGYSNMPVPVVVASGTVLDYPAATANVASPGTGTPAGFLYDPSETCTPYVTAHLNRTTPMFNAYLDLGHWWGFTPYVGAGVGFSYLQSSSAVTYNSTANGLPWAPNLAQSGVPLQWVQNPFIAVPIVPTPSTAPTQTFVPNVVTPPRVLQWAQINPNQYVKKVTWKFSWNLMAGVSYDISQNLKIDVHYRLLDAGSYTGLPSMLTLAPGVTKELVSQEVRVGVRLTSD